MKARGRPGASSGGHPGTSLFDISTVQRGQLKPRYAGASDQPLPSLLPQPIGRMPSLARARTESTTSWRVTRLAITDARSPIAGGALMARIPATPRSSAVLRLSADLRGGPLDFC